VSDAEPSAEPIEYTFTVFTATRNRAHTLDRPFEALKNQTFRDFEWLIVDNGSTDGTPELIERYRAEADFPIRYIWQEDAGKHISANRAVGLARGMLFVTLDSDDGCIPTALERFKYHWDAFSTDERAKFTGVTGLCLDEHGNLVGTRFPNNPTDSDSREIRYRYKVKGEKWGFHQTRVLRDHLFPETPGYRGLIPPTRVWAEVARQYKTRYINEALHVYWLDQVVSLSRPVNRADDAYGAMLEAESILNNDMEFFVDAPTDFMVVAIKFSRSAFHTGRGIRVQWKAMSNRRTRTLWAATLPAGWLAFRLERLGLGKQVRRIRLLFER
jgi:glycosyltransferase involved in cell wall biosynthesis